MFKIAVCDDNKYDINEILDYLKELEALDIHYEVTSYESGYDLIRDVECGRRFHLLILDMLMDEIGGIETAKRLRESDISMHIFIVTSTVEFALEGYKVNAWRYMMKPLDRHKFISEVVNIYNQVIKQRDRYFEFSNDRGVIRIQLDDILYFESDIHTITVKTIKVSYSFRGVLSKIEQEYRNRGFCRIHRSYLVNLKHVTKYNSRHVMLADGEELDLSRKKAGELHDRLLEYVSGEIEEETV